MTTELSVALAVLGTFLGVLFLYAGLAKFLSLRIFTQGLLLIPHLPHRWVKQVGVIVAAFETITGVGLALDERWAKFSAILLLGAFTAIAALAIRRNQKIPCNCFGANESEYLSTSTIVRNLLLVCIAVTSLAAQSTHVRWFTEVYGATLFLVFLIAGKALQNHRQFAESFNTKLE